LRLNPGHFEYYARTLTTTLHRLFFT